MAEGLCTPPSSYRNPWLLQMAGIKLRPSINLAHGGPRPAMGAFAALHKQRESRYWHFGRQPRAIQHELDRLRKYRGFSKTPEGTFGYRQTALIQVWHA